MLPLSPLFIITALMITLRQPGAVLLWEMCPVFWWFVPQRVVGFSATDFSMMLMPCGRNTFSLFFYCSMSSGGGVDYFYKAHYQAHNKSVLLRARWSSWSSVCWHQRQVDRHCDQKLEQVFFLFFLQEEAHCILVLPFPFLGLLVVCVDCGQPTCVPLKWAQVVIERFLYGLPRDSASRTAPAIFPFSFLLSFPLTNSSLSVFSMLVCVQADCKNIKWTGMHIVSIGTIPCKGK